MEKNNEFANYYTALEVEQTASFEEIKKNYQRLVLLFHPDKCGNNNQEKFLLIQKAWLVLRDPKSRKQYDAVLACFENNDILLYDTIPLSAMNFDSEDEVYSYECRCGGIYYLEKSEHLAPHILISCNECSFSVQVNI